MKIFVELITWRICSDSMAATEALAKTTAEPALVWESIQALEKLSGSNTVTLVWIPGHRDLPGNE
jgi:ribonuclease HI